MNKSIRLLLSFLTIMILWGCNRTRSLDDIIGYEPCVEGTVTYVSDKYIMIDVMSDDPVYAEYQQLMVSLDVEVNEGNAPYYVDDDVYVFYDGTISNGKLQTVYAITVHKTAGRKRLENKVYLE